MAGALDVSVARLIGGAVAVGVAAVVGWRLLAPPSPPPDMQLPFADPAVLAADTTPADTTPAGPESDVVVHVVGAVTEAGVEHLPPGSRVVDALDAAGGTAPDADLARLNLAQVLDDGQQVYVARVGEAPPTPAPSPSSAAGPPATINLNTATAAELEELPGVGPATAEAIIAAREEHRFGSVDDLLDVRGIGEAKLAELRDRVTV